MRWTPAFAGLLLCFVISSSSAQESAAPEIPILERIKAKAAENLLRQPNYTCTETIERFRRSPFAKKLELLDKLRLEVALVEGKELFSWPGAGKFEEKSIAELVGHGAIGNGSFALHAKHVFMTSWPTYTPIGETMLNARPAIRYDYRVPRELSTNRFRSGSKSAILGYRGSFWVERDTLDLIRLEVHADAIPPELNLAASSDILEYQRMRIGDADFLLPQSSELSMIDRAGNQSLNRTALSDCKRYAGESVLRFGDDLPDPATAVSEPKRTSIRLPAGLIVEIRLETPIQPGLSATGDILKAVLSRDLKKDGKTLAPKGAVLTGRLTRLQNRPGGQNYHIVGMDFSAIEFGHDRVEFRASLENNGLRGNSSRANSALQRALQADERKTGGVMAIGDSGVLLRRGHVMVWRTVQ